MYYSVGCILCQYNEQRTVKIDYFREKNLNEINDLQRLNYTFFSVWGSTYYFRINHTKILHNTLVKRKPRLSQAGVPEDNTSKRPSKLALLFMSKKAPAVRLGLNG